MNLYIIDARWLGRDGGGGGRLKGSGYGLGGRLKEVSKLYLTTN